MESKELTAFTNTENQSVVSQNFGTFSANVKYSVNAILLPSFENISVVELKGDLSYSKSLLLVINQINGENNLSKEKEFI